MNELSELRRRARELADLNGIGGLLLWDQNTMMPPGGADARADQFEALERIQHKHLTDPQLGRILEEHFDLPDVEALLDDVYARAGR